MRDQYSVWAQEVCQKLYGVRTQEDFQAIVTAALRGAAVEALDHAETVIAKAAKKEVLNTERRAGVAGARMVVRALSMAIKSPIKGDVKEVVQ